MILMWLLFHKRRGWSRRVLCAAVAFIGLRFGVESFTKGAVEDGQQVLIILAKAAGWWRAFFSTGSRFWRRRTEGLMVLTWPSRSQ